METCLSDVNKHKQLYGKQFKWDTKVSLIKMISFLSFYWRHTRMHTTHGLLHDMYDVAQLRFLCHVQFPSSLWSSTNLILLRCHIWYIILSLTWIYFNLLTSDSNAKHFTAYIWETHIWVAILKLIRSTSLSFKITKSTNNRLSLCEP